MKKEAAILSELPTEHHGIATALLHAGNGTRFARMIPDSRGGISPQADAALLRIASGTDLLPIVRQEVVAAQEGFGPSKGLLHPGRRSAETSLFAYSALLTTTPFEKLPTDVQQEMGEPTACTWVTTVEQPKGYISIYDMPEIRLNDEMKKGTAGIVDGVLVVLRRDTDDVLVPPKYQAPSIGLTTTAIQTKQGVIPPGMWLDVSDSRVQKQIDEGTKIITTQEHALFGLARPALPVPSAFGGLSVESLIRRARAYDGSPTVVKQRTRRFRI